MGKPAPGPDPGPAPGPGPEPAREPAREPAPRRQRKFSMPESHDPRVNDAIAAFLDGPARTAAIPAVPPAPVTAPAPPPATPAAARRLADPALVARRGQVRPGALAHEKNAIGIAAIRGHVPPDPTTRLVRL